MATHFTNGVNVTRQLVYSLFCVQEKPALYIHIWKSYFKTSHCDIYKEGRGQLKCDGTRAETRFRISAKRTSPFKSAGASIQSTTGSRRVCISSSNAGYTMFRSSVKGTGYVLHSPVCPSTPLPCFTVYHRISTGVCYIKLRS